MRITGFKQWGKNIVFAILILIVLGIMFMPGSYKLKYYVDKDSSDTDNPQISSVEFENKAGSYEYESDESKDSVIVSYNRKQNFEQMTINANTTDINMKLLWNGITLKSFGNNIFLDNGDIKYAVTNDIDETYTIEELLDKYCNDRYLIVMAVGVDYYDGMTESVQQAFNNIGIKETPLDAGKASSFYAIINKGKLVKSKASSSEELTYKKDVGDHNVELGSAGQYVGNWAGISIDDESYATSRKGLNVVVYDLQEDCLTDSLAYQDYPESMIIRNTEFMREPSAIVSNTTVFETIDANINMVMTLRKIISGIIIVLLLLLWASVYIISKAKEKDKNINKIWYIIHQILLCVFIILSLGIGWGYLYLREEFEDVSIAQLLYHMTTNLGGTNWEDFKSLFIQIGISVVGTILFIVLFSIIARKKKWRYKFLISSVSTEVVCGALLMLILFEFDHSYGLYDYVVSRQISINLYEEKYVDPAEAQIIFPEKKKNLIYIFMESMEISDSDIASGGGKETDYIPELTELALDNECFNGTDTQLNGAYPLGSTGWTVAGMVAQTSGVPLNTWGEQNRYGDEDEDFLPGAYSIGQILEDNGYQNCIMMGSDANFANRKKYFKEHGDYEICDYWWAVDEEKIPSSYYEWWGYEDEKLFEYAKEKVTELADSDKPFNLTLLTADTHFTDGYVCELCDNKYSEQYSNVLACNSRQIAEFVEWLQQQDFYEDTVIVLSGDHLCMDSTYFEDMPDDYNRRTYVNIINSDKSYVGESRTYSTMDMFPTTLSALGCTIEGDRLGLGTDLYSSTATLTEEIGKRSFDYQLGLNSKYYNQKIMN